MDATPPAHEASAFEAWVEGDHATGEWGGARTDLAKRGVTLDLFYTSEVFAVVHGGLTRNGPADYRGHIDLGLTLDTEKLGAWKGGKLYVLGQNGHGHGVTERWVGAGQLVSNLEAEPFTQLAEAWYEQTLFDGLMLIRLGKQDANRDFAPPRYAGHFINGSFGGPPTVPLPTFPAPGLGGLVRVQPAKVFSMQAGVYEGSPQVESFGFDSASEPGAGVLTIASVAVSHTLVADHRHGGITSLGVWHHDGAGDVSADNGVFLTHSEQIFEQASGDSPEGLHMFIRFAWAPPDRNETDRYLGGGVAYLGIPGRPTDTVGLGAGSVHFVHALHGAPTDGSELVVEAFYKARFMRWLSIEPDLQLFRHPGGDGRDAVVLGVRSRLKL